MLLAFTLVLAAAVVMGAHWLWQEEAAQRREPQNRHAFFIWLGKGLGLPLLLWTFFNCGWVIQPLLPQIALAPAPPGRLRVFFDLTAGFLLVATTWWGTVTSAWVIGNVLARAERRVDVLATAGVWILFALPFAAVVLLLWGGAGSGLAAGICLGAAAMGSVHLNEGQTARGVKPTYSRALAKLNMDKFSEAEWEIIRQLEDSETDFDGWMLLAELYAVHFKDLPTAEKTICDLCDEPSTNPAQWGIALNRLADWHLKIDNNPQNARWALQKLCEKLPGTHIARMAQARMNQLPATREEWLKLQQHGHTHTLLKVEDQLPLTSDESHGSEQVLPAPEGHVVKLDRPRPTPTSRELAEAEAARCVEQLKENPDDVMARERFATLLAESLSRPDTAIEQLDLLLAVPNQPENLRAQWMTRQAEWHLKFRNDTEAARAAYQRVISEVPQSQAAFDAQRRLYMMQVQSSVKLKRRRLPGDKLSAATESLPPPA